VLSIISVRNRQLMLNINDTGHQNWVGGVLKWKSCAVFIFYTTNNSFNFQFLLNPDY
jgi:hypothetical protein